MAERRSCSRQSLASPLTAAALRHSLLTAAPPRRRLRLEPQVLRKLPDLECYTNLRHYGIVAFGLFGVIFYFLGCLPFPSLPPSIASTGFHHCRACDRSDTLCAQSAGSDRVWLPFLSFPLYVFVTIRRIEKAQTFDDPDQLASYGSLYDKYAVHADETHRHSPAAVAVAAHCKQRPAMASCFVRSRCSSRTCNRR